MQVQFYHICTKEDHPDIFLRDNDFKNAINMLALCLAMFSDLKLYAFEFMSNHFHLLISGSKDDIESFVRLFISTLKRYYNGNPLYELSPSCFAIRDMDHLLNTIVYIHRNASAVDKNVSPCTYKWGTGRYYFNPEARARFETCKKSLTQRQRQQYSHSRRFDYVTSLYETDGYISPMSFCAIEEGEHLFTSASQYLYKLVRNVESSKSISSEICERITYSDYELYPVVKKMAVKSFETEELAMLTVNQKIQIARMMHYEYNSGNKQIARLLKLDVAVVNSLFPQSAIFMQRPQQ